MKNKDLTTLFTGRHLTLLPEVDSTNSYLEEILRNIDLPEGSVIRAVKQSAGRGQRGEVWHSEEGKNLLLSFLFYPSFLLLKDVFLLNMAFTLSIYDFVLIYLKKHVSVKWPNDIYWKNKKVSGILIENSISGSMITHSILGVGININQTNFSDDLQNPVSFTIVKHKEFDLEMLFNELCSCIEHRYIQLKKGEHAIIKNQYQSVLYGSGEWRFFESNGKRFRGCMEGVDDYGRLKIQTESGERKKFDVKEIRFLEK